MPLPRTFNLVEVRGRYVDLGGSPVVGRVEFTPSVSSMTVQDELAIVIGKTVAFELIATEVTTYDEDGTPDGTIVVGAMTAQLPATDDPDVAPAGFFYAVKEVFLGVTGRSFNLQVPVSAVSGIDLALAGPTPTVEGLVTLISLDAGRITDPGFASGFDGVIDGGTV